MRRKPSTTVPCRHEGCTKTAHYQYDNQKDYVNGAKSRDKWKCPRHSEPGRLISIDNPATTTVLIATSHGNPPSLYWHDGEKLKSGQCHGDGYIAYAYDFPEGTQLTITAALKLPD